MDEDAGPRSLSASWCDDIPADGSTPTNTATVMPIPSAALGVAAAAGMLPDNPLAKVERPNPMRAPPPGLSSEQPESIRAELPDSAGPSALGAAESSTVLGGVRTRELVWRRLADGFHESPHLVSGSPTVGRDVTKTCHRPTGHVSR